jgi:VWFA-related protein
MRPVVRLLLALIAAASPLAVAVTLGQQAPTFKSGVELIVVDVTVVDKAGRPVSDLKPGDFTVSIDGKPRTIASAHYQDYSATTTTTVERREAPAPAAVLPVPSGRPEGRSVVLVVDTDSMEPVVGLELKQAAHRFLDKLGPNDRVAVVTIPRLQSEIALEADRDAARKVIDSVITGITTDRYEFNIGTSEALEIERGDPNLHQQVVDRECHALQVDPSRAMLLDQSCGARVDVQLHQMQIQIHLRGQRAIDSLLDVADRLVSLRGPKTMLFVSGGMPRPDARSVSPFTRLEQMFAAAQITLYTLYMERSPFGDLRNQVSPSAAVDDMVERDGLENATAVTGGTFMLGIGTIDQYFMRVLTELSGSYLLGVHVAPSDKDGKPHRVEVGSNRRGLEIRSRKQYLIGDAPAVSIKGDGGSLGVTAVEHVMTAARDLATRGDIGVRVAARLTRRGDVSRITVQASIDPRTLYLVTMDGRRMGRLALGIFVGGGKRAAADAALWQEMNLALGDESYQKYKASGIPFTAEIPVTAPPRYVKLVVYEYRSGSVGAATTKVK